MNGDLSTEVGSFPVEVIVGLFGALGVNENGETLLHMCDEEDLIVGTHILRNGRSKSTQGRVKLMRKRYL